MAGTNGHRPPDSDPRVLFDPPPGRWEGLWRHRPDRLYLRPGTGSNDGAVLGDAAATIKPAVDPAQPLGICLSGGGIRSASYSLGALQAFGRAGWLKREGGARYLAAVSGGSYIAGAVALAARGPGSKATATAPAATSNGNGSEPVAHRKASEPASADPQPIAAPDPFAPGSPEELYLRNHLLYLREAPGGIVASLARVVLGVTFNIACLVLALGLVGVALGAVYGGLFPGLRQTATCGLGNPCPVQIDVLTPLRVGAVLGSLALLTGWAAVALRWKNERWRRGMYVAAIVFAAIALTELVFNAGIPKLLQLLRNAGADNTPEAVQGTPGDLIGISLGSLSGLLGALVTGLRSSKAQQPAGAKKGALAPGLARILSRLRDRLVDAAIMILGPALAVAVFCLFVNLGAYKTPFGAETSQWGWVAGYGLCWLVALGLWRTADLVAWSLHPIYKRRLARAFAVRRVQSSEGPGAEEIPYDTLPTLSKSQTEDFPEVLICAAANVSDYGKTPAGANVTSFVFSADRVGGSLTGEWKTTELEGLLNRHGRHDLTLLTAIAVSGAAVSPAMGKMTRRPLRFLLAVGNVRLGVWMPNPLRRDWFEKLDEDRRVFARPQYFFQEMLGLNNLHDRFLYVSDGGHYENLGLVELLRRHCRTIWCIDASGDKEDTFSTIGQAIAIARAEHLVDDVAFCPRDMGPDPAGDARTVRRTHKTGTIKYCDGTTARLVVIKLGVPEEAPWDVTAFQRRDRSFPCDSTANQLYTAERFEAYRALGYYATARALKDPDDPPRGAPPPPSPEEMRIPDSPLESLTS